jgi:hypothetical protein
MDLVEAAHWQLAGPTRRRFLAVLAHGLTMTARCWKLLQVISQREGRSRMMRGHDDANHGRATGP